MNAIKDQEKKEVPQRQTLNMQKKLEKSRNNTVESIGAIPVQVRFKK